MIAHRTIPPQALTPLSGTQLSCSTWRPFTIWPSPTSPTWLSLMPPTWSSMIVCKFFREKWIRCDFQFCSVNHNIDVNIKCLKKTPQKSPGQWAFVMWKLISRSFRWLEGGWWGLRWIFHQTITITSNHIDAFIHPHVLDYLEGWCQKKLSSPTTKISLKHVSSHVWSAKDLIKTTIDSRASTQGLSSIIWRQCGQVLSTTGLERFWTSK